MHLQRIQVPDFRVLKDVDITFENEFVPSIFPLASQNGGGKSTLLQLIFVLLHCSSDTDRIPFLKNMLYGFKIHENLPERILAEIDIWDSNKTIKVNFFSCKDSRIKDILDLSEDERINDDIKFSAPVKLKSITNELSRLSQKVNSLEKRINRLKELKTMADDEIKERRLKDEISDIRRSISLDELGDTTKKISVEEVQEAIQKNLEISIENHKNLQAKSIRLKPIVQRIVNYLESENLIYICKYSANGDKTETEVLLCHVNSMDVPEIKSFLDKVSRKTFLAAPEAQVFIFLSQESKRKLFKVRDSYYYNDYYSSIRDAKSKLPGFFTYQLIDVNFIVDTFKKARDQDFRDALETGEYGNNYKSLGNDFNRILANKRISLNQDLSGVTFKLEDRNGENIELYLEDLSQGELKRFSIYLWIKYSNIENAIVLMDKIEIALHPDWQYQIVSDLQQWAPSNQYILATHSYELCQALTPSHVKELPPKLLKQESNH